MRISPRALVLVVDGRKALLLRNDGAADIPDLTVVYGEEQADPADRHQKSDAAGQAPAFMRSGQSTTESADYHQQAKDEFARHIAGKLDEWVESADGARLIVVAPPKILGVLRKHYSKSVAALIDQEIAKDLTGHTSAHIVDLLSAEPAGS